MLSIVACSPATVDPLVVGAAHKPLVLVSGQTEQIPSSDYLLSPGGASFNGTPATAPGDIEVTTINGVTPATGARGLYGLIMSAVPTTTSTGLTTWGNQPTGATVTNAAQGIQVHVPNQGFVAGNAMLTVAAPAPPYSISILAAVTSDLNQNLGMMFGWVKNGSGGKSLTTIWNPSAGCGSMWKLQIATFNTYTSFNSSPVTIPCSELDDHVLWWQIKDDGTTASISYSATGEVGSWFTIYSVTKAGSFLGTYDLVTFGAHGFTGAINTEILSWTVTSP